LRFLFLVTLLFELFGFQWKAAISGGSLIWTPELF